MIAILETLRWVNVAMCLIVGSHMVATFTTAAWAPNHPYVRFLRLGTSLLVFTTAYGTVSNWWRGRLPTETTALITVALIWLTIGTIWTMVANRKAITSR